MTGFTSRNRQQDRGQSVVVSAVLLLGVVVAALVAYQALAVPQQVKQSEIEHDRAVRDQLRELSNAVDDVAFSGITVQQADVSAGPEYESSLFITPPAPKGQFEAVNGANMTVQGVQAVRTGPRLYWNGSAKQFQSTVLRYSTQYSNYQNAPTYYVENGGVIAKHGDGRVSYVKRPELLDADTIDLRVFRGNPPETTTGTYQVEVAGPGTRPEPVVASNPGGTIEVTIPSSVPATEWEDILNSNTDPRVQNVASSSISDSPLNKVTITFDGNYNYSLRLPRAHMETETPEQKVSFLRVGKNTTSLSTKDVQAFGVTALDRYGYPVDSVDVNAGVNGGGAVSPATAPTRGDGTAEFSYTAPKDVPDDGATAALNFTVPNESATDSVKTVSSASTIGFTSGGEVAGKVPPNVAVLPPDSISLSGSAGSGQAGVSCGGDVCTVDLDQTQNVEIVADYLNSDAIGNRVDFTTNSSGAVFRPTYQFTEDGKARTTFKIWQEGRYEVKAEAGGSGDNITIVASGSPGAVVTQLTYRAELNDEEDYRSDLKASGRVTMRVRGGGGTVSATYELGPNRGGGPPTGPNSGPNPVCDSSNGRFNTDSSLSVSLEPPYSNRCQPRDGFQYGLEINNKQVSVYHTKEEIGGPGTITLIGEKPSECFFIEPAKISATDGGGKIDLCRTEG